MRPVVTERQQQLVIDLPADPLAVSADPRMQQILMNLLANALKFTPPSGRISVVSTRIDRSVNVAVRDDGQGVERSLLPRMFDLFTRGDGGDGGFAVGLAVASYFLWLVGTVVAYATVVQAVNTIYIRRFAGWL